MARMDEDDFEYNDEEDEGSNVFRWLQTVVVLFALGGFFGLAWYAYKSGDTVDEKDVELVKVEKTPVKEAPANPGGMQIPNQDKTVYNLINGDKTEKPVVERILPPTEEPVKPDNEAATWMNEKLKNKQAGSADTTKTQQAAPTPLVKETDTSDNAKTTEQFNPTKAKEVKVAVITPQAQQAAVPETKKEAAPAPAPVKAETKEPVKEAPPVVEKQETPQPEESQQEESAPPAPKAEAPAKLPKVRIQLGALKSEGEAEKTWTKIAKTFPDEMGSKKHYIVRVLVHGNVFYRLQAAPFASSKEADEFCLTLVSAGQGCFLAKDK